MGGVAFLKKTWFTSDWHVGHANVLNFCKETRPFKDLDEMHDTFIRNYNALVKDDHICYFLGDFAFKGTAYAADVVKALNGTKIIIQGNHDKGLQSLINMGFSAAINEFGIKVGGLHITASHFPLKGIKREKNETFRNYNGVDSWHGEWDALENMLVTRNLGQSIHLHGHLHSPNRGISERWCGNQLDVGVDANACKPLSLNMIIKEFHKRPKDPG